MSYTEHTMVMVSQGASYVGAGTNYVVQANNGSRYVVFSELQSNDLFYTKSISDVGRRWSPPVSLAPTVSLQSIAVWYGRWSGLADDRIHIAYIESSSHDLLYTYIDTSTDTVGTPVQVFNGASVANGGALSICKDRAGNLRIVGSIDAGAEDGAWSSTDNGATWGDTIADPTEGASGDMFFCAPDWAADTNDFALYFWDASANEISKKAYDDSADSWGETAIATMTDVVATTAWCGFAVVVDVANSRNFIFAWSNADTATARLQGWVDNGSSITALTDVVSNSTDDQWFVAAGINTDTGDLYVFYGGKTDGSETYKTALNIYYKVSTDDGATWGAETAFTTTARDTYALYTVPRFTDDLFAMRVCVLTSAGVFYLLPISADPAAGGGRRRRLITVS